MNNIVEKTIIVIAADNEIELAQEKFPNQEILVTGIGGLNVIDKLMHLDKNTNIINVGYVGSNVLPVGTEVEINQSRLYHPIAQYDEPIYVCDSSAKYHCYTSNDFVVETKIEEAVVFDMELAYICALGFKSIRSIKIVSDNLSLQEYHENT